ncbi:hypothetical protein B0H16DRAFT_1632252 [Mycena metata]|uniref:Cysteine protease n=1 Tax=Mycena metata TaxID=1033252 RepID=A0AAD7GZ67_9AGAR|nr:hypothetical protein B0H16DRAFT_1632252 [Mycena metata]
MAPCRPPHCTAVDAAPRRRLRHARMTRARSRRRRMGKEETKRWGDPGAVVAGLYSSASTANLMLTAGYPQLLYTFPQSISITGGRPSSLYYFVGAQGDGLFYLEPHHCAHLYPSDPS